LEFQERIKQKKKILQKEDEEEDLEEGVLMISTEKEILEVVEEDDEDLEVVEEDDEEIQGEKPRKLRKQSQLLGR